MEVLRTERLVLGELVADDAPFIVELLNEPSFLRYIGDKGVRTLEDGRDYVRTGPRASYERYGYGLYRVDLIADRTPIGICGLVNREGLENVDIGFALLPAYEGRGFAFEAATAVLEHAHATLQIARVVAITSLDNPRSVRLLEKLGLRYERDVRLSPDSAPCRLFTEP